MEFFKRKPEVTSVREVYTLTDLITSLAADGFSVSTSLQADLDRFGLVTGIVLVRDGSDGMRVDVDVQGNAQIVLYNALHRGNHPRATLAQQKYQRKRITQE